VVATLTYPLTLNVTAADIIFASARLRFPENGNMEDA
jgi:hypothetical protein